MSIPAETLAEVTTSIVDESSVFPYVDVSPETCQSVQESPVRCRGTIVQQPRVGINKRPSADARHQRAGIRETADPFAVNLVADVGAVARSPRIDQHVKDADFLPGGVG